MTDAPEAYASTSARDAPPETASTSKADTPYINRDGKTVRRVRISKRRPARVQVDPATFKPDERPVQTGTIFNIWYNKWSGGDREDPYLFKRQSPYRCVISRDSGYTRADSNAGRTFCLYFARGSCVKGADCEYLHRLPSITDIPPSNADCFGREKEATYRDDMGGVGSFERINRTLYVGRIALKGSPGELEEAVARNFAEWGEIERTRVLGGGLTAFVTYMNEANAQFAREAMACQSIGGGDEKNPEILNVRWATPDPNPAAQAREARRIEELAAEAIRRALPAAYVAEVEGRDPEQTKRRKIEGTLGLEGYEAPDNVWYAKEKGQLEAGKEESKKEEVTQGRSRYIPPGHEYRDGEWYKNGERLLKPWEHHYIKNFWRKSIEKLEEEKPSMWEELAEERKGHITDLLKKEKEEEARHPDWFPPQHAPWRPPMKKVRLVEYSDSDGD
ncbi:uncharacterized protein BDR25DRAFT_216109 [Lindgomyces ingoldianus]|uniref:Uncharacterized protein n=1 Tax=Lindgomyces ingoldianus TaxID=673940 RepID=A0ACB6R6J1_9PLEO|nr:uncharacterized protein BDR25DRAFT_216109 [Lindgomyces ingoldianus]KAF2474385.1 hypothetical protein BDR25DRAFT_216109 [Lindgomyces ingoldianus]